jgi:GTPase SAR1 family protein
MTDTEIGRRIELNASRRIIPVKIVVAGGFGVGKTTLVGTISEITPLTTEAAMTSASIGIDDAELVSNKTTTTVAMDFGRITVSESVVLYILAHQARSDSASCGTNSHVELWAPSFSLTADGSATRSLPSTTSSVTTSRSLPR